METNPDTYFDANRKIWWENYRKQYNIALVVSSIISFFLYFYFNGSLVVPNQPEIEITIFTLFFQAVGFLVMVGIANLLYSLGYLADRSFNKTNSDKFRIRLFYFGTGFCVLLPLTIPTLAVINYFLLTP